MLKKLTQSEFTAAEIQRLIISECGEKYDEFDREFPFRFLETISGINLNIADRTTPSFGESQTKWIEYIPFGRSEADTTRSTINQLLLSHTFSVRHCKRHGEETDSRVAPDFAYRKNNSALSTDDVKGLESAQRKESSSEEWILRGDSQFTEWLFCIDGVCPRIFNDNKDGGIGQYYDEIEIDFLEIYKRHLSDVLVLASSDFDGKLPEIKLGIKVKVPVRKLVFLPEMVFSHLYESKKISSAWLNMLDEQKHARTLLESIEKHFPNFRVYLPGSVKVERWKSVPIILPDDDVPAQKYLMKKT